MCAPIYTPVIHVENLCSTLVGRLLKDVANAAQTDTLSYGLDCLATCCLTALESLPYSAVARQPH